MSAVESPKPSGDASSSLYPQVTPAKKKLFSRLRNEKEKKVTHQPVSMGCYNCSHYLSAFTYWKPSPCANCVRSPEFSFRLNRSHLVDNWEQISSRLASRMNVLY